MFLNRHNVIAVIFIASWIIPVGVSGNVNELVTLHDPTRPFVVASGSRKESTRNLLPVLNSILIGARRKLAVIDGVSMSEGENLGGFVLEKINTDSVDIRMNTGVTRLHLDAGKMYKEAN